MAFVVVAILAMTAFVASAQQDTPPPSSADVKEAMGPVISAIIWPFHMIAVLWWYITKNTSAAILLSATSAGVFAWRSMKHQASTTRLRETFATVNRDNWDDDVIEARRALTKIKSELSSTPGSISKYAHKSPVTAVATVLPDAELTEFIQKRTTLQTILNDYENIALGIKHGILDELFLYQWMRTTVITDWNTLSPLVSEYRRIDENAQLYVEFEGLAAEWAQNRSYQNNKRRLNKSQRWLRIR